MASIGRHGLKLVAIHLSLFFGPKWTFCTVCLYKLYNWEILRVSNSEFV